MDSARVVLLILLFSLRVGSAFPQGKARLLEPGKPVESELAGAQTHTYTLNLEANLVAWQEGAGLVLSVSAPDGIKLFDLECSRQEEAATIAARQGGAYRVKVWLLDSTGRAGHYRVRLDRFLTETEYLVERLAGLGRLWGAIKFFHPFLAYKEIDWDGALVAAIPRVKAARGGQEYREAIQTMLQALRDPATTAELAAVEPTASGAVADAREKRKYSDVVGGFVVIDVIESSKALTNRNYTVLSKVPEILAEIEKSKGVVLDCRFRGIPESAASPYFIRLFLDRILPNLLQGAVPLGTERYRIHNGYPPQRGSTSGGYTSAFVAEIPGTIAGVAKEVKPLAVLIDWNAPELLPVWAGLQAAGARIVQSGRASGTAGARSFKFALPDGVLVNIRLAEFVHPGGGTAFVPDLQLSSGAETDENAIAGAIAVMGAPGRGQKCRQRGSGGSSGRTAGRPISPDAFPCRRVPAPCAVSVLEHHRVLLPV